MIDLYYWPTPNGQKIAIMLEECGLKYQIFPINILEGDQFKEDFLALSPNNRIPAIVDHLSPWSDKPVSIFESGAILMYLGRRCQCFYPEPMLLRTQVDQWLMWQMGGLGPMLGQANHFLKFAHQDVPYGKKRYHDEALRLYAVLDRRLARSDYVATDQYTIADMACFPWVERHDFHEVSLADFPHLKAWRERLYQRPAVQRAYEVAMRYLS